MDFDQHFFLLLIAHRSQRLDARPVKDSQIVKVALGLQKVPQAKWLPRTYLGTCHFREKRCASYFSAQRNNFTNVRLRPWINCVYDVHEMAIGGLEIYI